MFCPCPNLFITAVINKMSDSDMIIHQKLSEISTQNEQIMSQNEKILNMLTKNFYSTASDRD